MKKLDELYLIEIIGTLTNKNKIFTQNLVDENNVGGTFEFFSPKLAGVWEGDSDTPRIYVNLGLTYTLPCPQ